MHPRQEIREAVKAALVALPTAAGARVYETRAAPWGTTELPAISVYTESESVDPESQQSAPRELTRNMELAIEAAVIVNADVDDALDDLAVQIERAMNADPTFGDVASDSILASTELGVKMDGARPMGMIRLVYSVRYYTYVPEAEDLVLDDFDKADIRYNLEGEQDEADEAHDILEDIHED